MLSAKRFSASDTFHTLQINTFMETKTISQGALDVIDGYLNFSNEAFSISIPYYNNRRSRVRFGLRSLIGKGSVEDIHDEVRLIALKEKKSIEKMPSDAFKKFLVDHNVGIDCSGFCYHVLDAESVVRGKGSLKSRLSFPYAKKLFGKLFAKIRPAENAGVSTFAHNDNSTVVELADALPGDFITMLCEEKDAKTGVIKNYNHIVLIHKIDYSNGMPAVLYYTHSMAWPSDGEYGHGVRQGMIGVTDIHAPITSQRWTENGKTGSDNFTHARALKSHSTEIRRLRLQ
jgi:hypothetical protein